MQEKISHSDLVKFYNVEIHFLDSLEEFGLLKTFEEDDIKYIYYEELPNLERFANWHYDLEVNLPGLEIIHDLLSKMENLMEENRNLSQFKLHLDSYTDR
ncbi:chaperone modulator CbpM [Halpernia frigidisoli]|uniref:MerR HTH family regulatory protein n=1 Tax=Halpernia frigidisoli TaxID=1125876 RepID=A0A1I3FJV7_9FLAO|nr:chaperone modulator CbpM [Halpernia frigidisoli]SFI11503.1 MerR HTH family regulatory protein [Halpernia frigidisoli]